MRAMSLVFFDSGPANGANIKTLSSLTGEPIAELPRSTVVDFADAYRMAGMSLVE